MMFPPLWLRIKIRQSAGRNFGLWLPLILIWPLVLALAIILLPFILLISIFQLMAHNRRPLILILPRFFAVVCALRGLKVDIESSNETVYVVLK